MFRTRKCKVKKNFLLEYITVINIWLKLSFKQNKTKSLQHLKNFYMLKILIISKKHKLLIKISINCTKRQIVLLYFFVVIFLGLKICFCRPLKILFNYKKTNFLF